MTDLASIAQAATAAPAAVLCRVQALLAKLEEAQKDADQAVLAAYQGRGADAVRFAHSARSRAAAALPHCRAYDALVEAIETVWARSKPVPDPALACFMKHET